MHGDRHLRHALLRLHQGRTQLVQHGHYLGNGLLDLVNRCCEHGLDLVHRHNCLIEQSDGGVARFAHQCACAGNSGFYARYHGLDAHEQHTRGNHHQGAGNVLGAHRYGVVAEGFGLNQLGTGLRQCLVGLGHKFFHFLLNGLNRLTRSVNLHFYRLELIRQRQHAGLQGFNFCHDFLQGIVQTLYSGVYAGYGCIDAFFDGGNAVFQAANLLFDHLQHAVYRYANGLDLVGHAVDRGLYCQHRHAHRHRHIARAQLKTTHTAHQCTMLIDQHGYCCIDPGHHAVKYRKCLVLHF